MKAAVICSGGMDSVTALYYAREVYDAGLVLSFDYGQRHIVELESARSAARDVDWPHHVVNLRDVTALLCGSSLTDGSVPTPFGHYSQESMRKTVVPGRNAMMLSLAWGVAAAQECDELVCGVHAGDHYIYPDCRPEFVTALGEALRLGTLGHAKDTLHIAAPFLHWTKVEILRLGLRLGVPYQRTWTCYEGGAVACGRCGSCNERLEAFAAIGATDPLPYAA